MVAITIKAIWGWNFLYIKDLNNRFNFLNNHKTIIKSEKKNLYSQIMLHLEEHTIEYIGQ